MKKLPGVREVEFAKGDKEGSHKLTFTAASGTLTKNDAELALGEHVKEFAVVSPRQVKVTRLHLLPQSSCLCTYHQTTTP